MGSIPPFPASISPSAGTRFFLAFYEWNTTLSTRTHAPNLNTSTGVYRPSPHHTGQNLWPRYTPPKAQLCERRVHSSSISPWLRQLHTHSCPSSSARGAPQNPLSVRNISYSTAWTSSKSAAYAEVEEQSGDTKQNKTQEQSRSSTKPPPQPQDLSLPLRQLMRRVPYPIVVITSSIPASPSPSSSPNQHSNNSYLPQPSPEHQFRGMTISSLTTVTLSPVPHITFNIKLPSSTYTAMQASGYFLAHIMASTPAGARVADVFARGGATAMGGKGDNPFWELVAGTAQADGNRRDSNTGIKVYIDPLSNSSPLIAGSSSSSNSNTNTNPTLSVLRCKLLTGPNSSIQVGDHVVVVGEIVGILDLRQDSGGGRHHYSQGGKAAQAEEMGLLYVNGQYRHVGPSMTTSVPQHDKPSPLKATSPYASDAPAAEKVHSTLSLNVRRGDEGMEEDRRE